MTEKRTLIKDTILYGVANLGSKLLTFLLLPLYTRYFTTEEYGLWDVVLTTTTLLAPFITFELTAAVYRWLIVEKIEKERRKIITTGLAVIIRNLLVFTALTAIILIIYPIPYGWTALFLLHTMILSSFLQQCARGLGYNKLFASLGIIQSAVTAMAIILLIFVFELRVEAFFYSAILASVVVIFVAWIAMDFRKYISFHTYSKELLGDFFVYALPIIPGAVSWWVMNLSDRYFIIAFLGVEANGLYAVANKIPALLVMVNTVFSLAWKDHAILSYDSAEKNTYYSSVFQHFFRLMATSVVLIILLAKPLIDIFIGEAFHDAWKYTGILLIGALFSALCQFWGAGFHGAKKTRAIFLTSIAGAGVNVLINVLFIKYWGLYAVAVSTMIAFLVMWVFRVYAAKHYFNIVIRRMDFIILSFFIIGATILSFSTSTLVMLISIAGGICLLFAYNYRLLHLLWRKGRRKWFDNKT
ncbi:lipopolysaccharide biosynthesis protein [Virgibacillus halodenitrificans]|uniref:Oligosaccharide flippase family protein n=1 Tax=Virgibacillus halodenitrificans TaxID=1482 RepID=A0ABR7VHJ2_VIRHA|nr:oligosaccharide flippase family protein [Virgibacillus halodenitrificans]MBD1221399.1 oligosaccharide flippase family protein [Virgibacillus halodenitrificans]